MLKKVRKKMVKSYCEDILSYIDSREKRSKVTKGEIESFEVIKDMVNGLFERVK